MRANTRIRLVWTIVLLLIVAGLVYGYWPRPRPVEVAQARRAPLQVTVQEEGQTRVIDRFILSAPVAGYARRIGLDVGDRIDEGEVVALLEPPRATVLDPRSRLEAQARVAAARAALRAAEQEAAAAANEAELAHLEFRRIRELAEQQLVPESQADQARTRQLSAQAAQRSAEFGVQVAQHQLEAARTALRYADPQAAPPAEPIAIRAPVAGNVLQVFRESEGMVNVGQPLVELGDPSALEVVVDVLSVDAVRIRPGMRVLFRRWGGDDTLEGQVRTVEPVGYTRISALGVEEQRVNVIADFTSPPQAWQRLGHGYRVDAGFVLWEDDSVLQIPSSSLFRVGAEWAVFQVVDGTARRRPVRIGQRGGIATRILGGLDEGDTVITHPDATIAEGVSVQPLAF